MKLQRLLLLLASAALAIATAPPVAAVEGELPERLQIERGKAQLIRLDERVTRVSIADPSIADVSLLTPTQLLLTPQSALGTTNLIVWHGEDRAQVYDVTVVLPADSAASIVEQLGSLVPEADVRIVSGGDGLILDGSVPSLSHLERVLAVAEAYGAPFTNLLQVAGNQQVQLEVQVAEVSRSGLRRMGLGFLVSGDTTYGITPAGDVSGSSEVSPEGQLLQSAITALTPFGAAFQLAALDDDFLAVLSILREQGLARLLATPTLVAMSGQQASFLVGGEFAVPIAVRDGVTSVEFKEFGTLLRFTPTVVGPETISLQVAPEVSNTDESLGTVSGGVAVPGVRTRRASTTLQLKDGQTFVMAGLLQEENSLADGRVPFLGDIPWLGSLFTRKEQRTDETELVIAVTAHLAQARNPDDPPSLPGADWQGDPSDVDFFLRNRTIRKAPKEPAPPPTAPALEGDFGYAP